MDLFREKRWKVRYPVQLFTEDLFIEGQTVDLSLHGLRVATERFIRQGTRVVVRVLEPEGECAVDCVLYTVRWTNQGRIGLEAMEISATEQRRLRDRLTSLGQGQEPVIKSTNPCIAIDQPITSITGTVAVLWQLFFPGHSMPNVPDRSLHSLQRSKR
jgi:hypothetical protein